MAIRNFSESALPVRYGRQLRLIDWPQKKRPGISEAFYLAGWLVGLSPNVGFCPF